ncbi:MAG: hypothetical protein K2X49_26360 [Acetobacteraceae bacterium]|nr:hypothetical protein [Acetobacteraceae bacterium]
MSDLTQHPQDEHPAVRDRASHDTTEELARLRDHVERLIQERVFPLTSTTGMVEDDAARARAAAGAFRSSDTMPPEVKDALESAINHLFADFDARLTTLHRDLDRVLERRA